VDTTIPAVSRACSRGDIHSGGYNIHWLEHLLETHLGPSKPHGDLTPAAARLQCGIFRLSESRDDSGIFLVDPRKRRVMRGRFHLSTILAPRHRTAH